MSPPDERLKGGCSNLPYGLATDSKRSARWFTYGPFGDVLEASECTDGETFSTQFQYDSVGRQQVIFYPAINGARFAIEYHYTRFGFLWYLTDHADGSLFWVATAMNAMGQVTQERTRNGVETLTTRNPATGWLMDSFSVAHADGDTVIQNWVYHYDELGNLRWRGRADAVNDSPSEEVFGYDPLNRLTSAEVKIAVKGYDLPESYVYDDLGNLTTKGSKSIAYDGSCFAGGRAAGPHAVCTVNGGPSFRYDANGNLTSGNGHTVTYTRSNKAQHIVPDSGDAVDFVYGADDNRVVQLVGEDGATSRTVYVGNGATGKSLYERTARGAATEHVHFIYAGDAHGGSAFAMKIVSSDGAGGLTSKERYYHTDHLGSVTATSDEQGRVIDAAWGGPDATTMGYDAWGARRNPDGTAADPTSFNLQVGEREFTGHETIPGVTLVNMNGRVYDPTLGRFLSPDPNVQFAADLQSYNRYSYVLNNPLRYTDPTGYSLFGSAWEDWTVGVAIGIVSAVVCVGSVGAGCGFSVMMVTWYTTTTMAASGASGSQILEADGIGLIGSIAGAGVVCRSARKGCRRCSPQWCGLRGGGDRHERRGVRPEAGMEHSRGCGYGGCHGGADLGSRVNDCSDRGGRCRGPGGGR